MTKALPPVTCLNHAVSRDLESVVHKATAKDPDERYQSALAFAGDLENVLAHKPVAAPLYRYRFDERDIIAERPIAVLYISFLLMSIALFLCWATFVAMTRGFSSSNPAHIDPLSPVLMGQVFMSSLLFLAASFILKGHQWARLMTAAFCVILGVYLISSPSTVLFRYMNATLPDGYRRLA